MRGGPAWSALCLERQQVADYIACRRAVTLRVRAQYPVGEETLKIKSVVREGVK